VRRWRWEKFGGFPAEKVGARHPARGGHCGIAVNPVRDSKAARASHLAIVPGISIVPVMKLFYTGPLINAEMLVVMLEKHGIAATQEFVDPALPDDGDLNRLTNVLVPEAEYDKAHRLFYTEREDEL